MLWPDGDLLFPPPAEVVRLFDRSPSLLCIADADGLIRHANNALVMAYGGDVGEMAPSLPIDLASADEEVVEAETCVTSTDGTQRWVAWTASRYEEHWYVVGHDVTRRREMDDQAARLSTILESSHDAIVGLSAAGVIETWNRGAVRLYGHRIEEALGRNAPSLLAPDPRSRVRLVAPHRVGRDMLYLEAQDLHRDGRLIDVAITASSVRDPEGRVVGAVWIIKSLGDVVRLSEQLRHAVDRDPVTGTFNRRRLVEELERQLRFAVLHGHDGAVLVVDVDHFTVVNDTRGHAVGDDVLRSVSEVLRARARQADVVGRTGADDFVVVLPDASRQDALAFARDVSSMLHEPAIGPPIMVSIGIAEFGSAQEVVAEDVLTCADMALFDAREQGGGQTTVYSSNARAPRTWVRRIRASLDEDRFVLFGQPIFDLQTDEVAGRELLIRMQSEDGTLIPPAEFLPVAERFGLIRGIDQWVITSGLALAMQGEHVSINLSGRSIGEASILSALRAAIADGLDPRSVLIEITETAAVTDMAAARKFAASLDALGVDLALDDFGTGYGSLTYFKQLPVRYIKLDRSFVRDLAHNRQDQLLIEGIVNLAHSFDKRTIAEGIEDIASLAILREIGVDLAQGYLLGRPEPMPVTPRPVPCAHTA